MICVHHYFNKMRKINRKLCRFTSEDSRSTHGVTNKTSELQTHVFFTNNDQTFRRVGQAGGKITQICPPSQSYTFYCWAKPVYFLFGLSLFFVNCYWAQLFQQLSFFLRCKFAISDGTHFTGKVFPRPKTMK